LAQASLAQAFERARGLRGPIRTAWLASSKSSPAMATRGLRRAGAEICGGGASRPPSSQASAAPSSGRTPSPDLGPPLPPSGRTGLLHSSSAPTLIPYAHLAQNVPSLGGGRPRKVKPSPDPCPKAVWTDSCSHLGDETWPAHAVPLFVFSGRDRPRPGYREEITFTLRDEKYVVFALRLRCGGGDRYMGGSVGLVHDPDKGEVLPGSEAQLATITDIVVKEDNTIVVKAVGDLPCRVLQSWLPRGLRGLQLAFVEVDKVRMDPGPVPVKCSNEPDLRLFAQLLQNSPRLLERLMGPGPFTVFAPQNCAFASLDMPEEELLAHPNLEALLLCHICTGLLPWEAMYNGRTIQAIDGTLLNLTFAQWPRGKPSVNKVPVEHMDVGCINGVIHCVTGLLSPAPAPGRPRR